MGNIVVSCTRYKTMTLWEDLMGLVDDYDNHFIGSIM